MGDYYDFKILSKDDKTATILWYQLSKGKIIKAMVQVRSLFSDERNDQHELNAGAIEKINVTNESELLEICNSQESYKIYVPRNADSSGILVSTDLDGTLIFLNSYDRLKELLGEDISYLPPINWTIIEYIKDLHKTGANVFIISHSAAFRGKIYEGCSYIERILGFSERFAVANISDMMKEKNMEESRYERALAMFAKNTSTELHKLAARIAGIDKESITRAVVIGDDCQADFGMIAMLRNEYNNMELAVFYGIWPENHDFFNYRSINRSIPPLKSKKVNSGFHDSLGFSYVALNFSCKSQENTRANAVVGERERGVTEEYVMV